MQIYEDYHLFKLKEEFSKRERKNPSYSLRAFANFLGIDSGNLSAIFRKKRNFPRNRAAAIADKLNLTKDERGLFLLSIDRNKFKIDGIKVIPQMKRFLKEKSHFDIIAEWEYFTLLTLMNCSSFKSDIGWIANRLEISHERVEVLLYNLLDIGFIKQEDNQYIRITPDLETSEDVISSALQESHAENLEMSRRKLSEIDVSLRDFSSMTIKVNPKRIPEAKSIIREFQDKLESLMETDDAEEVYIFNSQLFPLTKVEQPVLRN
ncbi:MAG: TIGR02147 family protein [Bacteriovoracaceae bacterium]|nr:TIGR02147 family protein [Bacteriovoracaceae bacterium]